MDLSSAASVVRRIEDYYTGGVLRYLTGGQARAARVGVAATARSREFDGAVQSVYVKDLVRAVARGGGATSGS